MSAWTAGGLQKLPSRRFWAGTPGTAAAIQGLEQLRTAAVEARQVSRNGAPSAKVTVDQPQVEIKAQRAALEGREGVHELSVSYSAS